jgi:hypothetical protein
MFVTFILIHLVIVCVVLLCRTYETHPDYPLNLGVTLGHHKSRDYFINVHTKNMVRGTLVNAL